MPAKEIKELRQAGKLTEALQMATEEMNAEPDNIWAKRNISWVYYDYLKAINTIDQHGEVIKWLTCIRDLNLTADEQIFISNLTWQIARIGFIYGRVELVDTIKGKELFDVIKEINFSKPSEQYSILLKSLHKLLKDTPHYIDLLDWWGFDNFRESDFQKEQLPDGRNIISIAEQVYNAYSKQLLPKFLSVDDLLSGIAPFDPDKVKEFLPKLQRVNDEHPDFQYLSYYQAKLLLALGEGENVLEKLLPFARKKKNDFWVWEVLAEPLEDPELIFACYCRGLSCKSPEEMLLKMRQKMAAKLIERQFYDEAKTEIEILVNTRTEKGYKNPTEVFSWQNSEWYKNAKAKESNIDFYRKFNSIAESLLYGDVPEELIIVEFVNNDKKMLNFIASESKFGFFKFDRFLTKVKIGDVLKVRFQGGSNEGPFQLYSAQIVKDENFQSKFLKKVKGTVRIPADKPFGFIEGIYIHPTIIKRNNLKDGNDFEGHAIRSYNKEKKEWGWKVI